MRVEYGKGSTSFGPGVGVYLEAHEVSLAIDAYLVAHCVVVRGPRTILVNGERITDGEVYVDPSGFVIHEDRRLNGQGPDTLQRRMDSHASRDETISGC